MSKLLALDFALEWLVLATTCIAALVILHSFIIGQHYIIPTITLVNMILLGHLAYYGFQEELWAQRVLFWLALVVSAHCFFALFWAKAPAALLGPFFVPTYISGFLLFGALALRRYFLVY